MKIKKVKGLRPITPVVSRLLLQSLVLCQMFLSSESATAQSEASFDCLTPITREQAQSVAKRTERDYKSIRSLQARFVQDSYFAGLDKQERSQGKLQFLTPGRMDWDYSAPEPQRFVSDGDTLWYYQPTMNQVTLASFREAFSSDLPVSFLLGLGSLSKSFEIKSGCTTARGTLLTLSPREADPSLSDFKLLLDTKDSRPIGAKISDVGGNETTIELFDVDTAVTLTPASFHFDVPRGVDVIDKRNPINEPLVNEPKREVHEQALAVPAAESAK